MGEPLLGEPVLRAFGLNTRNTLAAAATKYAVAVDETDLVDQRTVYSGGRI